MWQCCAHGHYQLLIIHLHCPRLDAAFILLQFHQVAVANSQLFLAQLQLSRCFLELRILVGQLLERPFLRGASVIRAVVSSNAVARSLVRARTRSHKQALTISPILTSS